MFALHPLGVRSTTSDVADAIYPAPAVEVDAASQAERAVRARAIPHRRKQSLELVSERT